MPNYPTSYYKKIRGNRRRYLVTYEEDVAGGKVLTFSMQAHSMSEATAITIQFIDKHKIHDSQYHYTLTPKVSADKADHYINHEI